jgi:coproporphyrinogen III oxidase
MDWDSVIKIDNTNEYHLKQRSIGKLSTSDNDHEIVTRKLETDVKILRRGSHVTRLFELEKDESNCHHIDKNICHACVQHFYLRFILNIGDSRTGNILIRRDGVKGICGIDFEEIGTQKTKENNDPLTMIMKKVSKRQRDLYESYTNKITIFKNKTDLSDELAKTLSTLFKIDVEQMNERIEDYANCIIKNK